MPKKAKWNESPCPECKEPVAVDATRCPRCQASYSSLVIAGRKKANADAQKWGVGCIALIGFLLLAMCGFGHSDSTQTEGVASEAPMPKPGTATDQVKSGVKELNDEIMAAVKPCDEAGKSLGLR
jgi:hypothetical protein